MREEITVFIDEAGDPGAKDGLHYSEGRHEWFCLSALAVRSSREIEVTDWVREIREVALSRQSTVLHYSKIARERREAACTVLARKPAMAFCIASHKSNLRHYENERLGRFRGGQKFYNWCFRLLLERVTAWAEGWYRKQGLPALPLRVIFARRGGHSYEAMFAYADTLRMQHRAGKKKLRSPGLSEPFLDRENWSVHSAEEMAGLQLADMVASSIYAGANDQSPSFDLRPAMALRPIFARHKGVVANTGLVVLPFETQAPVPEASRELFVNFGFPRERLAGPGLR